MSANEFTPTEERRLAIAEAATGHAFSDRSLLRRALTHPSVNDDLPRTKKPARGKGGGARPVSSDGSNQSSAAPAAQEDYERLEFLGDAVISLVITEELYERFPHLKEGDLTKLKAGAVSGASLSAAASFLGLGDALFLGESVMGAGGRGLASALENGFEALVAALYLDAGFEVARAFVSSTLGGHIEERAAVPAHPKSELQELLQTRGIAPHYRLLSQEGPAHDRTFTVAVEVEGTELGVGVGRSKKDAEMRAAEVAMERLSQGETAL